MDKKNITKLREDIKKYDNAYYVNNKPIITDAEYDTLYEQLLKLEKDNPSINIEGSPTQTPGSDLTKGFKKVKHQHKMLSLSDQFSTEDLIAKITKAIDKVGVHLTCMLSPKYDGAAISLIYENKVLVQAATRGDGEQGDDITDNMKILPSVIATGLRLPTNDKIEVRGEAIISYSNFKLLCDEAISKGKEPPKNPRNSAAGAIKLHDSKEVLARKVEFKPYSVMVDNEYEILDALGADKFKSNDVQEMIEYISTCKENHSDIPLDGVVIRVMNIKQREILGYTSKHPNWAWAYKYPAELKNTKLIGVINQIGRTGCFTPVGLIEPVQLAGTTVSRVTLHNQADIYLKNINIGDTVSVYKSGEIIPAIDRVVTKASETMYSIKDALNGVCPSCNSELVEDEVNVMCLNDDCNAKIIRKITQISSRDALDIDGLGKVASELIKTIYDEREWTSWVDMFSLTIDDLKDRKIESESGRVQTYGEKNATKLINGLKKAKDQPLERWIYAVGVHNVGRSVGKEIARLFKDWNSIKTTNLLAELLEDKLKKEDKNPEFKSWEVDLGPVAMEGLLNFMNNNVVVSELEKYGINPISNTYKPIKEVVENQVFEGMTFCITGSFDKPRPFYKALIEENGGKVSGSISKNTSVLLCGEKGGSKQTKAINLGVTVWDLDTFKENIKNAN